MDLEKLANMIKEAVEVKDLMDFFDIKNEEEAASLWSKNLDILNFKWNDEIGYASLELLYDKTTMNENNTFYQELMKESLFLITFCDYDTDVITAFARMMGVLHFIYITRTYLKKMPEYQFYLEMFNEYKQDLRFISEWTGSKNLLDQISKASEIDISEIKLATDILGQLKKELIPKK